MAESVTAKTSVLEDIRSEKRILQAEREDAIRRLMSLQQDLQDITAMEKKIALETQTLERQLDARFEEEQYVEARRILSLVRLLF